MSNLRAHVNHLLDQRKDIDAALRNVIQPYAETGKLMLWEKFPKAEYRNCHPTETSLILLFQDIPTQVPTGSSAIPQERAFMITWEELEYFHTDNVGKSMFKYEYENAKTSEEKNALYKEYMDVALELAKIRMQEEKLVFDNWDVAGGEYGVQVTFRHVKDDRIGYRDHVHTFYWYVLDPQVRNKRKTQ